MPVPTLRKGNVYILYPRGAFDRNMSAELETKIYELNAKEKANIILNLKRVKGILSHGVHTLVEMHGRCKELGGTIKLCGLKRDVRFVLEFTKLNEVFEMFEEEEEAWKSFSRKPPPATQTPPKQAGPAGGASTAPRVIGTGPGPRPQGSVKPSSFAPSWRKPGPKGPPQGPRKP